MSTTPEYDFVVLGGGPGGIKAAMEASERGASVLLIESEPMVGGACVRHGTIPSKALRETASALEGFRRRTGSVFNVSSREDLKVESLMVRLDEVVRNHGQMLCDLIGGSRIEHRHGRGRFHDPHTLEIQRLDGGRDLVRARTLILATGSRPRIPDTVAIDHAHLLTSDSVRSLNYLPATLAVLGGGVIACEYASTFSRLGVEVHLVDRRPRPLGFVDEEIARCFLSDLEQSGSHWLPDRQVRSARWDGVCSTEVEFEDGEVLRTEKCLVALGRVANTQRLRLEQAGLRARPDGTLPVDEFGRTEVEHVFAVGDVVGHPGLAAAAIEQGQRAVRHAMGLGVPIPARWTPFAIYTIPEISCVGDDEETARREHGEEVLVGRARFSDLARGQIAAVQGSLLKMVADPRGKLLGVQIYGECAAELITVGQMALRAGMGIDDLLHTVFNFPTFSEAYRAAALDISRQREALAVQPA